jgi:hypothetical protein
VKKLFLSLAALACLTASAFASNPVVTEAHKTTHKIKMSNVFGGSVGSCSATAIGPHAILTATHCSSPSAVITIDDKDADVMGTFGDGLDHTIILVRGVTFENFADVDSSRPVIADDVFVFGNPGSFVDIYRKGVVAGFQKPEAPDSALEALLYSKPKPGNEGVQITFYDFNGFFGDSGSAIFNDKGKIIGVTSFIDGEGAQGFELKFMGSFELRLSQDALTQARNYNPPPAPVAPKSKEKHKSFFDFLTE